MILYTSTYDILSINDVYIYIAIQQWSQLYKLPGNYNNLNEPAHQINYTYYNPHLPIPTYTQYWKPNEKFCMFLANIYLYNIYCQSIESIIMLLNFLQNNNTNVVCDRLMSIF